MHVCGKMTMTLDLGIPKKQSRCAGLSHVIANVAVTSYGSVG